MANSITAGGLYFPPYGNHVRHGAANIAFSSHTITVSNAVAFVGRVFLADRSTSKLLSSAGGAISFRTAGVSVWTALSSLGIGIQDVNAAAGPPPVPDLAFDVSRTITSSTITLTANHWHRFTMSTGSKTLSHGEMYAFVVRMGNRVSTDAASVAGISSLTTAQLPMCVTLSAGTAFTAAASIPNVLFECDDGTLGWFEGGMAIASITAQSLSSGGTNNEYGMRFVLPWTCQVDSLYVQLAPGASTGDYTVRLYGDPKGTPTTVTAIAALADWSPAAGVRAVLPFTLSEPVTITASTTYLLAVGAGATQAVTITLQEFANAAHKITIPAGGSLATGARGGGAGAFSMVETNVPFGFGVRINQIEPTTTTVTTTTTTTITTTVETGGSGGIKVHPGMTGGVNG